MGSKPIIHSLSLGLCAKEILHNEESASMVGITSAGIFLRSEKGKIIFLTSSPWRGPLTINLSDGIKNNKLQAGIEVRLAYPYIVFPDFEVKINDVADIWQPDVLVVESGNIDEIIQRAEELSAALSFERKFLPFYEVLETITNSANNPAEKKARIRAWFYLKGRGEFHDINQSLERFIGLGAGLTPSGDDFIIGFLLVAFYLRIQMGLDFDTVLAKTYEKTTTLSANLMTCAARGSADERLIGALRFLLKGEKNCAEVKKELLSYGSSSGIETLAGMLTAIFLLD